MTAGSDWRPLADRTALETRAQLLSAIRRYFAACGVLEVTTPVVVRYPSAEPAINTVTVAPDCFLRTSPEAALKRLVAAGSGDVFEIAPVCRAGEQGPRHLAQFTLVEWYRLGLDHHGLMDDLVDLLASLGWRDPIPRLAYADVFEEVFGCAPHALRTVELAELATRYPIALDARERADRTLLFDVLYAHGVEPRIAAMEAALIYDFPREQRAYARLHGAPPRAARFELYLRGYEIANGYHEIIDTDEQRACFELEITLRRQRGLPAVAADTEWLDALATGMPACAGAALGLERLMLALGQGGEIRDTVAFDPVAFPQAR